MGRKRGFQKPGAKLETLRKSQIFNVDWSELGLIRVEYSQTG